MSVYMPCDICGKTVMGSRFITASGVDGYYYLHNACVRGEQQ